MSVATYGRGLLELADPKARVTVKPVRGPRGSIWHSVANTWGSDCSDAEWLAARHIAATVAVATRQWPAGWVAVRHRAKVSGWAIDTASWLLAKSHIELGIGPEVYTSRGTIYVELLREATS